jgi:predicted kinase
MSPPILYVFSGLPATGKTTLSQALAQRLGAVHLRIDTIEQALRDLCAIEVEGEGYGLAYRLAADHIGLGFSVVADSCNPIELTRREWAHVARAAGARLINIEVVCSDPAEHRRRVETRESTIPGLKLPTWQDVMSRAYDAWPGDRVVVDTFGRSVAACLEALLQDPGVEEPPDPKRLR